MTQQGTSRLSIVATSAIAKGRCVNWNGAQAGAGEAIIGIADYPAVLGDAVRIIPPGLTADAEAGAAINGTERRLATDANGRLIPWTAGIVAARLVPKTAANVAGAAGDFVEVAPIWA
jgi:hypothetical protein